jgi:hypothetical protein
MMAYRDTNEAADYAARAQLVQLRIIEVLLFWILFFSAGA